MNGNENGWCEGLKSPSHGTGCGRWCGRRHRRWNEGRYAHRLTAAPRHFIPTALTSYHAMLAPTPNPPITVRSTRHPSSKKSTRSLSKAHFQDVVRACKRRPRALRENALKREKARQQHHAGWGTTLCE